MLCTPRWLSFSLVIRPSSCFPSYPHFPFAKGLSCLMYPFLVKRKSHCIGGSGGLSSISAITPSMSVTLRRGKRPELSTRAQDTIKWPRREMRDESVWFIWDSLFANACGVLSPTALQRLNNCQWVSVSSLFSPISTFHIFITATHELVKCF